MDLPKKNWIAGFLVLLVVAIWIRGILVKPIRSHQPSAPKNNSEPKLENPTVIPASTKSQFAEWGGNPFEVERRHGQSSAAVGEPIRYQVSGIVWDPQSPSAIVNER